MDFLKRLSSKRIARFLASRQSSGNVTYKYSSPDGMTPVILITHIDEVCPAVQRNIQNTYSSFAVHRVVRLVSELSGVAQSEIFPLKNYCDELTLDSNIDIIALTALKKMLDCADAMLNKFRSR